MQQDPTNPNPDTLLQLARKAREQGRFTEAREQFQSLLALDLAPALEADARTGLATVLHMTGRSMDALAQLHHALRLREQRGDVNGVASIYLNLGTLAGDLGDHALALEYYEHAHELLLVTRDEARLLVLHINLGRAHIEHGDVARGERLIRDGLALTTADTTARHRTLLELNLAEALRRNGKLEDATEQYLSVVRQAEHHRLPDLQQRALHGQALVQVAQGEHVRARELLFEALTLARRSEDLDAELLAMIGLAEVSLTTGQLGIAVTDAELILVRAAQGQRPRFLLQGHDVMARACEGLSDFKGAYEHVVHARNIERTLHEQDVQRLARVRSFTLSTEPLNETRETDEPNKPYD